MAQFDVYRTLEGELLLDCQSDAFGDLTTRLVAPLLPIPRSPELQPRLNPLFEIDGEPHAMMTQFAAAIGLAALRTQVASLSPHRLAIVGAFDMLLTGI